MLSDLRRPFQWKPNHNTPGFQQDVRVNKSLGLRCFLRVVLSRALSVSRFLCENKIPAQREGVVS